MKQLGKFPNYFLLLWGISTSLIAKADSWAPPKIKTYYSDNLEYKLVITPKIVPEKYYRWSYFNSSRHPQSKKILRKKERFMRNISAQDTTLIPCTAELYRVAENDNVLLWKRSLLNDICPVHAIVANDGSSVVTFDNWYHVGYGVNVFVVYNEKGDAKSTYKLEEITPIPLNDYPMSSSSLYWRHEAKFIDNKKVKILFRSDKNSEVRVYNTRKFRFEE